MEQKKMTAEETFERLWKLYPVKRGKGKIKADRKRELHKIGYDKMVQAIERYRQEVEAKRKTGFMLAYQYGSTFFTSGYLDYLEEEYVPAAVVKAAPVSKKTAFHLPESRSDNYTNDELERILEAKRMQHRINRQRAMETKDHKGADNHENEKSI